MSRSFKNKGSLIIEALLAVVILSTSLSLILQSLVASLRANVYSVDYTQALILLESKMNESLMKGKTTEGSEEGDFPEPHERYSYVLKTQPLTGEDEENLDQLMLSIAWNTKGKKNNISLETYLFKEEEDESREGVGLEERWNHTDAVLHSLNFF